MGTFEGFARGFNQFSQNALQTSVNLANFREQARQRALQQEHLEKQNKLVEMQMKSIERDNELIPVQDSLTKLGFSSPEEHQLFLQKINPMDVEYIEGTHYITRKAGKDYFAKLANDPDFNLSIGQVRFANANKAIAEIDAQLQNANNKLKPEQIDALTKQRESLINQKTALANQMRQERGKLLTQNIKIVGGMAIDPTSVDEAGNPRIVAESSKKNNVSKQMQLLIDIYGEEAVNKMTPQQKKAELIKLQSGLNTRSSAGSQKAIIRVYIDTTTGARHVLDLNNPSHKRFLAQYGSRLIPESQAQNYPVGKTPQFSDLPDNPLD